MVLKGGIETVKNSSASENRETETLGFDCLTSISDWGIEGLKTSPPPIQLYLLALGQKKESASSNQSSRRRKSEKRRDGGTTEK
jgi:hypothetical protein